MYDASSPEVRMAKMVMQMRLLRARLTVPGLLVVAWLAGPASAETNVVKDGKPVAVVVTADAPTPVVAYAARELCIHVEKATGARLSVVTEGKAPANSAAHIYLGDCRAARGADIVAKRLAPEAFVLRTKGNDLFIVGNDEAGDPFDRDTSAGTMFGVYEWLERKLGIRWLWPGELGTFVPRAKNVTAGTFDETVAPRLVQRHVRSGLDFASAEHPALGFTPAAAKAYAQEQTVYLRRQRMGRSQKMSYGHAFTDWWQKYGKEHPEWFALVNGKRGPSKPGARYSMCVSNPELHQKIVDLWKQKGGAKPSSGPSYINIVENDILGQCECEKCRAWDGPPPPDKDKFYAPGSKVLGARFVSDRYARFEKAVQELAAKENPKAAVIGYAYFNYFQAPTSGVKLNQNVLLGFCPSSGWYPRSDEEQAWYKKQWQGWRDSGAQLFSRMNFFLDGYCMPFIFAHQFADEFQHQARNGMIATDFDSLTGEWSTQGPNLYLLMRLHTKPEAKADDLLAEYYSGFGPAATGVKAYFDYWERYTMGNRPLIDASFGDKAASRWRTWAKVADRVFPETSFPPADKLLASAAAAAAKDPEAAARVAFLRLGLEHAKLAARAARQLTLLDPASTPARGKQALEQLLKFRRAHEKEWIGNFNHLAWVEDASWKLSDETKQEPELYP